MNNCDRFARGELITGGAARAIEATKKSDFAQ
jgi:hypothetical protein